MPFIAIECSPDERPSFRDEAHGSEERGRTRAALDQVTPATGEQTSSASGGFPCSLPGSANQLQSRHELVFARARETWKGRHL
jgi:hypothetical protein